MIETWQLRQQAMKTNLFVNELTITRVRAENKHLRHSFTKFSSFIEYFSMPKAIR